MCKKCFYLFTVFLLIAVAFLPTANAIAEDPEATVWKDEFDGVLKDGWIWIKEEPTKWNLDNYGFLTIYTATEGTGTENLLLREVPADGDFSIETHMLFNPDSNFQFAGLVIYMDEINFLQFGRAYCGYIDFGCVGNGIYFDHVFEGDLYGDNFATTVGNQDEAYLRLERRGNQIKGYYSDDGYAWIEIGTHWIPEGSTISGVGLTSSNNQEGDSIPADFDYFELTEGLSVIPSQMIWADPYHNAINAWGWTPGEEISIQIWDPLDEDVTPEDFTRIYAEDGGAAWNSDELGIDLQGGYTIQMNGDISLVTKTLVVSPLEVQAYDFNQNKISGMFDPDLPIAINLWENRRLSFTTDGDTWEATFTEMPYGAGGEVWQTDEDGDMTGIGMWVPSPRLTVSITDDWFRAEDFPRLDFVMVTIYDSFGGSVLWQQERKTDENGFLFVGGWEFELDLKPEMVVEVSHTLVTKSIELETITMYVVDEDNEYLAGNAPPQRDVWVGAGNEFDGCGMTVTSNSEGFWEADFLNQLQPCYITPDMWKAAQVFDSDWDATEANPGFPRGSHDYDTGDVPSWACNVGGWVVDPDDQTREVQIRFYADDEFKYEASTTGHGFEEHFWELISSYETHIMLVEAFDVESDTWYPLENSPRELTCRTQDIYSFDPETGVTTQVTDLRDTNEFNPSWSPSGKHVAYDVVTLWDTQIGINITNLKTGQTDPLAGAEGGNDAIWSPNGKSIVFDRLEGDIFNLYIVPATGGKAQLLRQDAASADFSPNGKRLVFQQSSDGSLRTLPMDKKGKETVIAEFGANPSWSFNGNWIAYELDGDIWKVQVDSNGNPKGDPIQVTSGPFMDGQPAWSADSQNIIYHTGLSRDYDLWSVPATGGLPIWLNGAPEFGDYDPSVNNANSFVAYSSFSPMGQASRLWIAAFTYDLEPEYWVEGDHFYSYWMFGEPYPDNLIEFTSSIDAPIYEGTVLLRADGLRARVGDELIYIDTIHPSQVTQFHVGWRAEGTYTEALDVYTIIMPQVSWDGPNPIDLFYNEIFPFSSEVSWENYLYSVTW